MNKYCIIGKGFIFERHRQSIEATGGQVVMTCDIDPTKNPDYTDWELMFDSEAFKEVDTVVICTPNYLHHKIAVEALKRGKKVLCEKPLSIDGVEGLEGVNTVLQLRYSPEVNKIKEWQPNEVSIFLDMKRGEDYWKGWKGNKEHSGGLLYNLGIHYIDLLIYLLGEPLEIKEANGSNQHSFNTVIKFKDNKIGTLHIEAGFIEPRRNLVAYKGDERRELNISNKENLSYEDLHTAVYEHLIKGDGIPLSEARKSLELVEQLLKHNGNKGS